MNVGIIGTGYVGLITGVGLAYKKHFITCFDTDSEIINMLNKAKAHFFEDNLESLLEAVVSNGFFSAKNIADIDLNDFDLVIISVGTPSNNGKIYLGHIEEVSNLLGSKLNKLNRYVSIIVKSTVVPGTTDTFVKNILEKSSNKKLGDFGLGMNPEFLREGNAVEDFMNPDRIVFGYEDEGTLNKLKELYSSWECDKVFVNTRTAEMIKYANNAILATQISMVNELANIASAIGKIDILDVINGVSLDKRWSPILKSGDRIKPDILSYLIPGPGFGGSCFTKDLEALEHKAREVDVDPLIIKSVLNVNKNQPFEIIKLLRKHLGDLQGNRILLLGLSFKPGTDDIRASVSIIILEYLININVSVYVHDPIAMEKVKEKYPSQDYPDLVFLEDWKDNLEKADAIVLCTNWEDYKILNNHEYKNKIAGKVFIDTRRLFKPADFQNCTYCTIGRNI